MNFQKKLLGNLPFLRCDFGLPLYKYQNVCLSISNQNRSEEKECKEAFIEFLREKAFFDSLHGTTALPAKKVLVAKRNDF